MAQSANEKLSDIAIKHAVQLLRYNNGLQKDIVSLLNSADKALTERLAARLVRIQERGLDIGPATTERVEKLLAEIKIINDQVYKKVSDKLVEDLGEFAVSEATFQASAIETAMVVNLTVKAPTSRKLKALVTQRPLLEGEYLKPFLDNMKLGRAVRIEKAIRVGIIQGLGTDAIVRTIVGTKKLQYQDGILDISRRSAKAIVRTSITAVSNQVAQDTWQANEDLIKSWQFLATLDNITTTICASNDGQSFPIGKGPIPPLHPNCRSISVPVTKSFKELGLDKEDYSGDTRASLDGQVPASTTFDTWLKKRSKEDQEEILGKTKADLYRSGKLKLTDFVRNNREVLTLDELKKLHPAAFK